MNFGLILSVGLHLIVALSLTLEIYHKPKRDIQLQTIVVDLIEVKKTTNVKTSKHKAKIKKIEQKQAEKFYKNREADVNTKTTKADQPLIDKKVEKAVISPPKKVASKAEPKVKPVANKVSKPKPKTKNNLPKKSSVAKSKVQDSNSKKREIDSFAKSVMETLDVNTAKDKQYKSSISDVLGETEEQFDENVAISMSEVSYIRRKISQHWNTTYFSSISAMDMGADILVVLNHDGTIKHVEIDHSYGKSLAQYDLFLDSVLSAVWKASPLDQLQPEHYDAWHEIVISFDPSGMIY